MCTCSLKICFYLVKRINFDDVEYPTNKEESDVLERIRERDRGNRSPIRAPHLNKIPGRIQVLPQEYGMYAFNTKLNADLIVIVVRNLPFILQTSKTFYLLTCFRFLYNM